MREALAEPGSLAPHAAAAFARGQKDKESVEGVWTVSGNSGGCAQIVSLYKPCVAESSNILTTLRNFRSEVVQLLHQTAMQLVRTPSVVPLQGYRAVVVTA